MCAMLKKPSTLTVILFAPAAVVINKRKWGREGVELRGDANEGHLLCCGNRREPVDTSVLLLI